MCSKDAYTRAQGLPAGRHACVQGGQLMLDIKRRDKRRNNRVTFNKRDRRIGRPVGFNQVSGSLSPRLFESLWSARARACVLVHELSSPAAYDELLLSSLHFSSSHSLSECPASYLIIDVYATVCEKERLVGAAMHVNDAPESTSVCTRANVARFAGDVCQFCIPAC